MKATQLGVVAAAVAPGSTNTHQINHMSELSQIISEGDSLRETLTDTERHKRETLRDTETQKQRESENEHERS